MTRSDNLFRHTDTYCFEFTVRKSHVPARNVDLTMKQPTDGEYCKS